MKYLWLAAAALVLLFWWNAERWKHRALMEAFRADSTAAMADTTRHLWLAQESVYVRRVVQTARRADSLDHALHVSPGVRVVTVTHFDTVHVTQTAEVLRDPDDSLRSASFPIRRAPITATVDVVLPKAGVGRITFSAKLDSLLLDVRIGCGAEGLVHPALASVTGPVWAQIGLDHLTSDPRVCNAAATSGLRLPWWLGLLTFGLGWLLGH